MRPNSPYMQALARRPFGGDIVVYSIPEGTPVPKDLILVHERSDHYSLQPAEPMTLLSKSPPPTFPKVAGRPGHDQTEANAPVCSSKPEDNSLLHKKRQTVDEGGVA